MARFSDIAPAPIPRQWDGDYLSGQEKQAAVGAVFTIARVDYKPTGYQGKPEWDVAVVDMAKGGRWTITLGGNPTRDAMFGAIAKAIAAGESIDPVVFDIVGTNRRGNPPYGFRDATPDELAQAQVDRIEWDAKRLDEAEPVQPVASGGGAGYIPPSAGKSAGEPDLPF